MKQLEDLMRLAAQGEATDLLIKSGAVPRVRVAGMLYDIENCAPIPNEVVEAWIESFLTPRLKQTLVENGDVDFVYALGEATRYRVNLFKQRQTYVLVMRLVSRQIKDFRELALPEVLGDLVKERRGLILVTGASGSGKSTTMASMLQAINKERSAHIVTVEDPIEYEFKDKKSTINQREVGSDVESFGRALRAALRQTPDVIMVGELRDRETCETALTAAETGHLVMTSMHTSDAVESISRVMSFFPSEQHQFIRMQLSVTLKGVISQRLVRRKGKRSLVPAVEVLVVNGFVRNTILKATHFDALYQAIKEGKEIYGMQSFDQSLLDLYDRGLITKSEALAQATNPGDLDLLMSGIGA